MITRITSQHLEHNLFGDSSTRDLVVYLPPGYDQSDKRYPTLYLLHGYNGRAMSWLVQFRMNFVWRDITEVLDDAINRGLSQRLSAAGIDHQTKEHAGTHNSHVYERIQVTMEWFSGLLVPA